MNYTELLYKGLRLYTNPYLTTNEPRYDFSRWERFRIRLEDAVLDAGLWWTFPSVQRWRKVAIWSVYLVRDKDGDPEYAVCHPLILEAIRQHCEPVYEEVSG